LPRAALASGFTFRYPRLEEALAEIVGSGEAKPRLASRCSDRTRATS